MIIKATTLEGGGGNPGFSESFFEEYKNLNPNTAKDFEFFKHLANLRSALVDKRKTGATRQIRRMLAMVDKTRRGDDL
ncbi:MAG: hypothetical protein FWB80_06255 [Defluviitaleaceae bacterium]|nr:hypothetical protein [Defluviitaleaceae bacterium]